MCEHICACCFPCCFVCSKRGCGNDCCINLLLGFLCYIPAVIHACMFIGDQNEPSKIVVQVNNTNTNANYTHQQPMYSPPQQMYSPPQQMVVQNQPASGGMYFTPPQTYQPAPGAKFHSSPSPQQPQVHQFQPEAPPMYTQK